jgi:diguanylate cyclase (GGDEF)-like protein
MKNAQLETGRQRFAAVLENMSQGLTLFDGQDTLLVCNRRYADLYHLSPDQVRPGTLMLDLIDHRRSRGSFPETTVADYMARRKELATASKTFDITDELPDGRAIAMHYRSLPSGGWVVTHEEVTERRRTDAALTFMARHDALTGLPNRVLFQERLAAAVAAAREGDHCALLCLDLDRFKVVNDTLGHPVGDSLLCDVAVRLLAVVREDDTVARLGGDEFAIILANMKLPDHAASMAERILAAFDDPFDVAGHRITAATSIGVALAPKDGTAPDALLQDADIALYLAKSEGRGRYRFFEPEIDSYIQRRRAVEFDLRNAVPADDFLLHYQPVLDLRSGRVTGFEALVRWNHPVRGMVSPAEFIPIAEETGLIVPISAWVLQTACMEAAGWPEDIEIAVNLSPVQFKRGHLLEMVQGALAASGLAPNRLELEITESTLMDNGGDRLALLHKLRALGIRIALDDFGTGYSSLSYLRSFPFDKIKIDRSFIKDLDVNPDSATIVGAIVGLASGLRMTTVAEGVETERQLALVREQGIAKGQGYLFSRPRPASEVMGLIGSLRVSGTAADTPAARQTATDAGAERVVLV